MTEHAGAAPETPSVATPAPPFVGRAAEWAELERARDSGRPELVAVYGRRRVGKTALVRQFFAGQLRLELTGSRNATTKQQLSNFASALSRVAGIRYARPENWGEAFQTLIRYLETLPKNERHVVFLDEIPWLAGRRSDFLSSFEHFWNLWGTLQNNLIVVICGSSASWMITKVLRDRGGLHNRITLGIALHPFNLYETELFLASRGITLDRRSIIELTLATGGIPYYLGYVQTGLSAAQNIDALFFNRNAKLHREFYDLYASLFEHHERHLKVIRALAAKRSGLTRNEIVDVSGIPTGGNISTILDELESSDFIGKFRQFDRKREPVYRLLDELSFFHIRWVEDERYTFGGSDTWMRLRDDPAWRSWSGYAFENLCMRHVEQIKQALSIGGVQASISSWRHRASGQDESGAQIDLLIDRKDNTINACEMKFTMAEFVIDKRYAEELRGKINVFKEQTGTRKTIFLTMVTTEGVRLNDYCRDLVQGSVRMDALFAP